MQERDIGWVMPLVPVLLLVAIVFPLLLYVLPLIFFSTVVCLYCEPTPDAPLHSRLIPCGSRPRGPPFLLPVLFV